MKNAIGITGRFDNTNALTAPSEPSFPQACKHEALRFVKPPTGNRTVVFTGSPARYVRQDYLYHPPAPDFVAMLEENVILPLSYFKTAYGFMACGRDLYVVSCSDEYRHRGREIIYNTYYPYLRVPVEYNQLLFWAYQPLQHIYVYCTSVLTTTDIGGLECDALTVQRKIEYYADGKMTGIMTTTEYYIAGLGIQSMETTNT